MSDTAEATSSASGRSYVKVDRGADRAFAEIFSEQESLREAKEADPSLPDTLLFVEHSPIYTSGRGTPFEAPRIPDLPPVESLEINRGGQTTFHGPGQLVCYPIFDLNRHGRDVHVFLRKIEQAIIRALEEFGLAAFARSGLTGVWVPDENGQARKIASIGIGVRKWISFHGLALNVSTDMRYFRAISPCGQDGEVMINLADLCQARGIHVPTMDEVKTALEKGFVEVFDLGDAKPAPAPRLVKPKWLKVRAPGSPEYLATRKIIKDLSLTTVCEEAHCPNIGECWSHRTATFMIMGELCTRRCSFCAVKDGTLESLVPLDPLEPIRTARAVQELGLKHIVITSVDRDDIKDMGAAHFNRTVELVAQLNPETKIELLIPDMRGKRDLVEIILRGDRVSVLNHNVETVPRLYRTVRPGANFARSVNVLRWAKELSPAVKTKSGLMVGLGETREEVLDVMDQLRTANIDILTIGQYLQPTPKQLPVQRFVTPEEFDDYRVEGLRRGFSFVESGALVRSSYHAWKHTADETQTSPLLVPANG